MVNKFWMDSYKKTLDYLYNQLPMFQRSGPPAYKNSLSDTLKLDALYNHPHLNYKTIHIAGTNGKGSVSHMLAAILQKAGYKTGLYTSPHLKNFAERIRVNGKMIDEGDIVAWVETFMKNNRKWKISPSFFELTVIMAFDYFSYQQVDMAVIEVGLGGRLDSTNIITPEVSVITNIGYDHTDLLGKTLESIAGEKAGIIKKGVPVVIGRTQEDTKKIFTLKAAESSAPLFFADMEYAADYAMLSPEGKLMLNVRHGDQPAWPELKVGMAGLYQRENVATILKVCDVLKEQGVAIPGKAIYEGLANVTELTGIRGRWQVIGQNPMIICDTGHNEDGIKAVVEQLTRSPYKKLHIIFGTVRDKDVRKILPLLPVGAEYYFTKANIPRALDEKALQEMALEFGLKGKAYPTVKSAFETAQMTASDGDLIFVGGSTFVVAEILP